MYFISLGREAEQWCYWEAGIPGQDTLGGPPSFLQTRQLRLREENLIGIRTGIYLHLQGPVPK